MDGSVLSSPHSSHFIFLRETDRQREAEIMNVFSIIKDMTRTLYIIIMIDNSVCKKIKKRENNAINPFSAGINSESDVLRRQILTSIDVRF